jgi:hypothetical protein
MNCPSRRSGLFAQKITKALQNGTALAEVARTDYAGNMGNYLQVLTSLMANFPRDLGDEAGFSWQDVSQLDGVIFQRSTIGFRQTIDGTSHTYMVGEKYLNPLGYEDGSELGDNESMYTGFNNDSIRKTSIPPLQDTPGLAEYDGFGSAHAGIFYMTNCDGSVHGMNYDIEESIHIASGSRNGGETSP